MGESGNGIALLSVIPGMKRFLGPLALIALGVFLGYLLGKRK